MSNDPDTEFQIDILKIRLGNMFFNTTTDYPHELADAVMEIIADWINEDGYSGREKFLRFHAKGI